MLACTVRRPLVPGTAWLLLLAAVVLGGNLLVARDAEAQSINRNQFRNGALVLAAFEPVVEKPSESTVRIKVGGKNAALGFVVDSDGFVLTKASRLRGRDVTVHTKDGLDFDATVVGVHQGYDLAMLEIDGNLVPVEWAENDPSLGHWVVSVGPADEPLAVGVASVGPRRIEKSRGVLGIQIEESEPGPRIVQIFPDSGAEKAGLEVDDRITAVNGKPTNTRQTLVQTLGNHGPGESVSLDIHREGEDGEVETFKVPATLGYPFTNLLNRGEMQNQMGGELSRRRAGFNRALQHDTYLSPKDCGGPLVDLKGRVVGINIARAGRTESYAIPTSEIKKVLGDLKSGDLAPPESKSIETKSDDAEKAT